MTPSISFLSPPDGLASLPSGVGKAPNIYQNHYGQNASVSLLPKTGGCTRSFAAPDLLFIVSVNIVCILS